MIKHIVASVYHLLFLQFIYLICVSHLLVGYGKEPLLSWRQIHKTLINKNSIFFITLHFVFILKFSVNKVDSFNISYSSNLFQPLQTKPIISFFLHSLRVVQCIKQEITHWYSSVLWLRSEVGRWVRHRFMSRPH